MKKKLFLTLSCFLTFVLALGLISCGTKKKKDDKTPDTPSDVKPDDSDSDSGKWSDGNYVYSTNYTDYYDAVDASNAYTIIFYTYDYVTESNELVVSEERYDSIMLEADTKITALPRPTREGYNFVGWYVDYGLSTPFYHKTMPRGTVEAHAKWQINNDKIYVSPDGSPLNDGSRSSKALNLWEAARLYKPGAEIILAAGEYNISQPVVLASVGTSSQITKVVGTTENGGVTLNFSSMVEDDANIGIKLCGDYHIISDITIKGAGDNGMLIGGNNNIVKNCVFTENHDTGCQISRFSSSLQPSLDTWPSNNLILNCTSYNNSDTAGEDADGFAAKLTVGQGNVFDGCLAYWNVDDGWDLYAKQDSGPIGTIVIRNCVSLQNGRRLKADKSGLDMDFDGDGNGFKLGGSSVPGEVIVENCLAAYNFAHGFTDNSNPGVFVVKNCTSLNNGQFNKTASSPKEYDNFNLNRSSLIQNKNYYQGLFSYYDEAGKSANSVYKSDEFNGSLVDSILYYNCETYKVDGSLSIQMGEGFVGSKNVSSFSLSTSSCPDMTNPETLISTLGTANFHNKLRNSDGSLNLKTYWKVNTSSLGITCGANLYETTDTYNHNQVLTIGTNETAEQSKIREIYDALNLAINNDYIYNNIFLPTTYFGYSISWKSNNSALTISNNVTNVPNGTSYTYGVLANRITVDTNVTLTATIKVGNETKDKTFNITLQALDPRIGEITGIENINQLSNSANAIDINSFNVYDYTSTNLVLDKDVDYAVDTKIAYQQEYNGAVDPSRTTFDQTVPGIYTITYTFKINGYADVVKSCVITIVNVNDTYQIYEAGTKLGYIIDNAIDVNGNVNYNDGTLYAVATAPEVSTLTADQILDAQSSSPYISNVVSMDLNNLKFSISIPLNNTYVQETSANVFLFIKNANGNGEVYKLASVNPTIIIDNATELKEALTTDSGKNKAYKLNADINLGNETWAQNASSPIFVGYFDGDYHKISNLNIEVSGTDGGGLFFKVDKQAIIKNLSLEEVFVTQTDASTQNGGKTAVLIGEVKGGVTVENIQIFNCGANAFQRTSGLIGQVSGTSSAGSKTIVRNVTISSNVNGNLKYSIRSCFESKDGNGNTVYTGGKYVGGIIAHVQYTHADSVLEVSNCYVNTSIWGFNQFTAGIVGRIDPQKEGCTTTIENCVFAGSVNSNSSYAGGIIAGRNSGTVTIKNCVNLGAIIAASGAGQIISTQLCTKVMQGTTATYVIQDTVTMENCYWALSDYDPETEDITEAEYILKNTQYKEYYGTYKYLSEFNNVETWKQIGFNTEIFDITNGSFTLKCFIK